MKTSLFKKPWESKDEAIRAEATASLDHPKLAERLPHLAQHDPSPKVRLAALKRLNKEAFWLDARSPEQDPMINQAADHALTHALLHQADSEFHRERLAWIDQLIEEGQHRSVLKSMAQRAKHAEARAKALASIQAPGFLADCYATEQDASVAAMILTQIDQTSPLERILPEIKKRSKAKARALEERIETLQGQSQEDKNTQAANACLQAIERLILGQGVSDLASQWAALQAQWQANPTRSAALQARFERAQDIIEATLNPPARPEPTPLPESPPPEPATEIATAPSHSSKPPKAEPSANPKPQKSSPPSLAEKEAVLTEAKSILAQAETAIDEGHLKRAHEQLAMLPKPLPRELRSSEHRIHQKFNELKRWLHWSNNTQRDELIDQLEHALTQSMHPDALTALAQEAKQRWRSLETTEQLNTEEARPVAPHKQWRRFNQALANIREATQPAREHRQHYQSENWTALQGFIDKTKAALSEATEGTQRDTKAMLDHLKTARAAIRRLNDLSPKKRAQAADALKGLMSDLSAEIESGFADIEAQKRKLVAQAEQLAHEKDPSTAIETAKALQAKWRAIGSGRRASDQTLWKAFRTPIDPLFAELKQASETERAERRAHEEQLTRLITEIEALVKTGDWENSEPKATWTRLSDQWQNETQRPPKLETRFTQAKAQIEKHIAELKLRAKSQAKQGIWQWAEAIQQAANESSPEHLAKITPPPKPAGTDLDAVWQTLDTTLKSLQGDSLSLDAWQNNMAMHDQQARQVVVELEFLSGLETPAEDEAIKKAFQVQRLNERLNQRGQGASLSEDLSQRNLRWHQSIPMSSAAYALLRPRFERAFEALEKMLG